MFVAISNCGDLRFEAVVGCGGSFSLHRCCNRISHPPIRTIIRFLIFNHIPPLRRGPFFHRMMNQSKIAVHSAASNAVGGVAGITIRISVLFEGRIVLLLTVVAPTHHTHTSVTRQHESTPSHTAVNAHIMALIYRVYMCSFTPPMQM